jgi:hypothetical protein
MDPSCKLSTAQVPSTPKDVEYMKDKPYIHAVGSLMYLAISTHPDIAYVVGVLARFSYNPGVAHWKAVKHVFRYLNCTSYPYIRNPSRHLDKAIDQSQN